MYKLGIFPTIREHARMDAIIKNHLQRDRDFNSTQFKHSNRYSITSVCFIRVAVTNNSNNLIFGNRYMG